MANIIDGEEILHQAYKGILGDVITNISGDTKFMKDTDLLEDRNKWIKRYIENGGRGQEDTYEADIQTLAIMIEQIKRYGEVVYDKDDKNIYK